MFFEKLSFRVKYNAPNKQNLCFVKFCNYNNKYYRLILKIGKY